MKATEQYFPVEERGGGGIGGTCAVMELSC